MKVLDFGLAKALEPTHVGATDVTTSPTLSTAAMTERGVILGTAAYMSPEQAKGRPADKRSDIWAFGCVLFEMLTQKRPFGAESVSETVAEVLKSQPAWDRLPAETPQAILRLLRRCLTKEPTQRLPEIGTARLDIDEVIHPLVDAVDAAPAGRGARRSERQAWTVASVLLVAALALAGALYRSHLSRGSASAPEMRVEITTPPAPDVFNKFVLSPDGTKIVYVEGGQLWLRSLATETPQKLAPGFDHPFWSPDSQSIGFFNFGELKRLDLSSGRVQTLAKAPIAIGGTWGADDTILFVPSHASAVRRISAGGRGEADATRLAAGQVGHRFPRLLPDGRHFIYVAMGTAETRGVHVGSLDSSDTRRLFDSTSPVEFAAPDSLLFERQGTLLAQRIDLASFTLVGDVVPVAPRVGVVARNFNAMAVTASAVGRIGFRAHGGRRQLMWLDRRGQRLALLGEPDDVWPYRTSLSPDDRAVLLDRTVGGETNVWVIDTERATRRRLTHEPVVEAAAVWSPDMRRIAFASERTGVFGIYEQLADESGSPTILSVAGEPRLPHDWSPDGKSLVFMQQTLMGSKLWILPLSGDREPFPLTNTPFSETSGKFSPDSRWVAYASPANPSSEVYLRRIVGPSATIQVSNRGGFVPNWRRDGRELFYVAQNGQMMSVPLALDSDAPKAGVQTPLFAMGARRVLGVSSDGQRFLVIEDADPPAPITLVLNWAGPHR